MSFACLDDRWDEHPKYIDLDLEHFGLMACAIVYCNRQLTDGFVPEKAVRGFGKSGKGPKLAERLVAEGVWKKAKGGFEIVGYLDHNPSREVVLARKAKRAEAGERGGKASGQARAKAPPKASAEASASPNAAAHAKQNGSSHVEPSPILSSPLRSNEEISLAAAAPLHEPPPQTNGKTTDADFEAECARAAAVADAKRAELRAVAPPAPLSAVGFEIFEGKKP